MSAGRWFRCDLLAWDTLIERVRADGGPLSVAVASMDLRRHAHDPKSERAYARRWGWHHSRARRLIKGGDWIDPWKQGETQPQKPAKRAHSRTAAAAQQERGTAPTSNADNGPARTAGAQQAHSSGTAEKKHRNYNIQRSKINNTCGSESKQPDPFDQAVDLWKQHKPKGARMVKGKGAGRLLAARLKDHGFEAVRAVLLWGLTSEHRQADWLRQNGYCRISTLCNATKFEAYLEASKEQSTDRGEWVDHGNDERGPLPF